MADIVISELPAKTNLLDTDLLVVDTGAQTFRVTGKQLREFLKVNFLPIGTVVYSFSDQQRDNAGRLPLFTGEYIANASTLYPDFYAWVKARPQKIATKEQYDAERAATGVSYKFVVDEEDGSLRLPKIKGTLSESEKEELLPGNGITAGFPDLNAGVEITFPFTAERDGYVWYQLWSSGGAITISVDGVASSYGGGEARDGRDGYWGNGEFIAVKKGQRISTNRTVNTSKFFPMVAGNPVKSALPTENMFPWIYAINAAIPASVAQTAEFQGALTGKADRDLANIPENIDFVVNKYVADNGDWWEEWKSGKLVQGGLRTTQNITTDQLTFLRPFANSDIRMDITSLGGSGSYIWHGVVSVTNTGAVLAHAYQAYWRAVGQAQLNTPTKKYKISSGAGTFYTDQLPTVVAETGTADIAVPLYWDEELTRDSGYVMWNNGRLETYGAYAVNAATSLPTTSNYQGTPTEL